MTRYESLFLRVLLGMAFVSLSFEAFGKKHEYGFIVSTVIAVAMMVACLVASRDQFGSMFVLIALSTIGYWTAEQIPPMPMRYPWLQPTFFALIGCAVGLVISEWHYWRKRHSKSAASKPDQNASDSDDPQTPISDGPAP